MKEMLTFDFFFTENISNRMKDMEAHEKAGDSDESEFLVSLFISLCGSK